MKPNRILHIYGKTHIESITCPACGIDCFLISGVTSCCEAQPPFEDYDAIKFETDKIGAKRKRPSKRDQERILSDQGNSCFYCDISFERSIVIRRGKVVANEIHWDHIIPFVFNGNNDGFVAACALCNLRKSDRIFNTLQDAKTYLSLRHYEDTQKEACRQM